MQARQLAAVQSLIETAEKQIKTSPLESPLIKELSKEIVKLREMLKDPKTFASRLKERCSKRSHSPESISIKYIADTPANRLYWGLANLVIEPQNMQEMFAIMLPDIKFQLELGDVDNGKPHDNNAIPQQKLTAQPLHLRDSMPDFIELSHYVMTTDTLFDKRKIAPLSDTQQSEIGTHLAKEYPEMLAALEFHSHSHLSKTAQPQTAPTPNTLRQAIKRLIRCYRMGIKRNAEFTSEDTLLAIAEFMEFMDRFDENTQQQIRDISTAQSGRFGNILSNKIFTGKCAEETSSTLINFLKHARHELLDRVVTIKSIATAAPAHPVEVSSLTLTNLLKRTQRNVFEMTEVPNLVAACLIPEFIPRDTYSTLKGLLNSHPRNYYEIVKHYGISCESLVHFLATTDFNEDQITALVQVISRMKHTELLSRAFICLMLNPSEDLLFRAAMSVYTMTDRIELVNAPTFWENCSSSSQIQAMFHGLPPEHLYRAIIQRADIAERFTPPLISLISNFDSFMQIYAIYIEQNPDKYGLVMSKLLNACPADHLVLAVKTAAAAATAFGKDVFTQGWINLLENVEVFEAALPCSLEEAIPHLLAPNDDDETILHINSNAEILTTILAQIPASRRLSEILHCNIHTNTALQEQSDRPNIFNALLNALEPADRHNVLVTLRTMQNESLLYAYADNDKLAIIMILALDPDLLLAAILDRDTPYGIPQNALLKVARKCDEKAFYSFLRAIPIDSRLIALTNRTYGVISTAEEIATKPGHLESAIDLLPANDVLTLLTKSSANYASPVIFKFLHDAKDQETPIAEIQKFFNSLSNETFIAIFCQPTKYGHLIAEFSAPYNELIPDILARLPQDNDQRLTAAQNAIEVVVTASPEAKQATVNLLKEEDRSYFIVCLLKMTVCSDEPKHLKSVFNLIELENRLAAILSTRCDDDENLPSFLEDENSILDEISCRPEETLITLEMLPVHQRLLFLQTVTDVVNTSQPNVLESAFSKDKATVDNMIKCISLLSDDKAFIILNTKLDNKQTFLQRFTEEAGGYSPYSNFSDWSSYRTNHKIHEVNFAARYMLVVAYLADQNNRLRKKESCCYSLFQTNSAGKLLGKLEQCKTAEEAKIVLLMEVENPTSEYGLNIAKALTGRPISSEDIERLKRELSEIKFKVA